jgi:lipopolysaccharide/colanic/teichoic acid biosynthesis glycosyltransferase
MISGPERPITAESAIQVLTEVVPFQAGAGTTEQYPDIPWYQRVFEVCFASVALLVSIPIIAVIAVIIKLDTPGPAFFRQQRLGRGAKPFNFIKMRTFYADARERWPELYAYKYTRQQLDELYFKAPEDPRITPVGRWLRRTTFDELPNFWHVLTGDMNLIGPRPEIPEMLPYYTASERRKFSVKPGISGLAQVSGRGRLSFRETTRLDLEYVDRRSVALDFQIFVKTTLSVIKLDGAF